MSESDNIRKKMQELKAKENELASLCLILSEANDKCSRLSEEYKDLKANNLDFIELQQQLDKVMNELVEANHKRKELLKEEKEVQEQEEKLQESLEEANDSLEELSNQVASGDVDEERNGNQLANYKRTIKATTLEINDLKRTLINNQTELSDGRKDREAWEEILQKARSLLLTVEGTKQLLEEHSTLVNENRFSERYRKEFGKLEQLQRLCLDDRMYLRQ